MDIDLMIRGGMALAAVVLGLGLCLGIGRFLQKWREKGGNGRYLRVLETLPLDQKRRLILVQCDARVHLLLVGGGADVVVDRFDKKPPSRSSEDFDRADPHF
ncbi:MAG: flagellar biosynthetic protein FliO [Holosporales bacterium]|jgi:flagellar biogenesis protein FliO|nr:flagellar biosynthetic protein FliO [Holosporales bacterium]